jgi:hypothetical protein
MWTKRRAEERRSRLRPVYDSAMYTDPPAQDRIIPYMSSASLKTSSCRLPSRHRNEDLVTGGDVVLAFDRVVKQVVSS